MFNKLGMQYQTICNILKFLLDNITGPNVNLNIA